MINYNRTAKKIFSVLKGHSYRVKMYDLTGNEVIDPEKARRFYVQYPNMMITLDEDTGEIRMSKNNNISLTEYESALVQLKNIAVHYMLNFTLKDFGREITPRDFAYQAKVKKEKEMSNGSVSESISPLAGSRKTSYQTIENVKIHVKHKTHVDEEIRGARSRNISAIFIEHSGERFRFPHNNLVGARAMARHIQQGGNQYDSIGSYIIESCANYTKLREFMRYIRSNNLITEDSNDVIANIKESIDSIATDLKRLSGVNTYDIVKSRIEETEEAECDVSDVDKFKDMFTIRKFDDKFTDVLPIVSKLVKEKQSYLKKIEEAVSKQIYIESMPILETNAIIYENPNIKLGHSLQELSSRILENTLLANYISSMGSKLIKENTLNKFECSIIKSFFENVSVKKANTNQTNGLFAESINEFGINIPDFPDNNPFSKNKDNKYSNSDLDKHASDQKVDANDTVSKIDFIISNSRGRYNDREKLLKLPDDVINRIYSKIAK